MREVTDIAYDYTEALRHLKLAREAKKNIDDAVKKAMSEVDRLILELNEATEMKMQEADA
jgi:hypothetical protein